MIREAIAAELQQQLQTAKQAFAAAQTAAQTAQDAFDEDASVSAEQSLLAARSAADRAQLHVDRVERLLVAARARDAEVAREAAEGRLAALDGQLARAAVVTAAEPLADREAALLLQIAKVRSERAELVRSFQALGRERDVLLDRLGRLGPEGVHVGADGVARPGAPRGFQYVSVITSRSRIVEQLNEQLRAIDASDARHEELTAIIRDLGGDARTPAPHTRLGVRVAS